MMITKAKLVLMAVLMAGAGIGIGWMGHYLPGHRDAQPSCEELINAIQAVNDSKDRENILQDEIIESGDRMIVLQDEIIASLKRENVRLSGAN